MKIDAVGVSSKDMKKTVEFYKLLGFEFPDFKASEDHVEAKNKTGEIRLMIDSEKMATEVHGEKPRPGNLSVFAIKYDSPSEVNEVCDKLDKGGFKIEKQPWDAFWGQRYAVVSDPDGFKIDLFAAL